MVKRLDEDYYELSVNHKNDIMARLTGRYHRASLQRVSIAVSAVLAIVNPSVRPSVRPSVPSQSGTVSKRLKLGSWDLHWRIAP